MWRWDRYLNFRRATNPEFISPKPTALQTIQAYVDLVSSIRQRYPNKPIAYAPGSMDIIKHGSNWLGYIKKAVAQIKKMDSKANINTIFF